MALMLCDHLCMTILGNHIWLHYIGRIAYPIFAFMLVEGFNHTHDVKKYLLRLLVFACLSEIPFDLMCGGTFLFLQQQNVLFTFIIAILCMLLIEQTKKIKKPALRYITFALVTLLTLIIGFILGIITMVDYFGGGVVMVLVFYLFNGDRILSFKAEYSGKTARTVVKIINHVMQLILVYTVCCEMIGGLCVFINIFGKPVEVVVESFGVLGLVPIWLYNGEKGINTKQFKYFCYAFYPLHILALVLVKTIIYY